SSSPRYFRRAIEADPERGEAVGLRAEPHAILAPAAAGLPGPGNLRDPDQAREEHVIHRGSGSDRLRPERRLDAEDVSFSHTREDGRGIPAIRVFDRDVAGPVQAEPRRGV